MNRPRNTLYLLSFLLAAAALWGGPTLAADRAPYKIIVYAPRFDLYSAGNDFYELFRTDLEKHWRGQSVELRFPPGNGLNDPEAISRELEKLADDPLIRAVVAGECPTGSIDGFARLRAKRPDIFVIAIDPHEDMELMAKVATFTLGLNHQARGFLYPTMAQRMGSRSLVYFSIPRYMDIPYFARQHRIMKAVTKNMGMILVSDFSGPDPSDPGVSRADIKQYLGRRVKRYLNQYGRETAFVTNSTAYVDTLIPIVMRQGGNVLEAVQPSLLLGYPEALDLREEARLLFGHWTKLLALEDEKIMTLNPLGHYAVWTYPYPHTAMLAMVEIVIPVIENQADIYELIKINAALEKHSPGVKWLVSLVTGHEADAAIVQAVLLLQDTYWFGHGFQGFTR